MFDSGVNKESGHRNNEERDETISYADNQTRSNKKNANIQYFSNPDALLNDTNNDSSKEENVMREESSSSLYSEGTNSNADAHTVSLSESSSSNSHIYAYNQLCSSKIQIEENTESRESVEQLNNKISSPKLLTGLAKETIISNKEDTNSFMYLATCNTIQAECNSSSRSRQSKHKTKFQTEWVTKYPWLKCDTVQGSEVLICKLCSRHLRNNKTYKNSAWITKGFATVRLDKIKEHSASNMHIQATETEIALSCSENIQNQKFEENSPVFNAMKYAMKCMNFLIQHNIPHTTVFKPFIDFLIDELEVPVLKPIKKAKNASYTSYETTNEILASLAEVKREEIYKAINESPSYTIMIDETTDINNRKHLAVVAKYLKNGEPSVSFVRDIEISNGTSETVFSALSTTVKECGGFGKMSGFGSDGASAMIGVHDGVAAKVKRENNCVIAVHCLNHRLALAAKESFESQKHLVKLDETLIALYKYYKGSSVRSTSLAEVQKVLNEGKGTTIKRAGHTRWLSHSNAINSVRKNIHAIIIDLEKAVETSNNSNPFRPTAEGLLKRIKTFDFFQIIHFMCDVLSIVTKLTLALEKRDLDLSVFEDKVTATLDALKKLKCKPGGLYCKNLVDRAHKIGITTEDHTKSEKFENTARTFIDSLTENISRRLENIPIITFLSVLNLQQVNNDNHVFYGTAEMSELAQFYKIDEDDLLSEWDDFKNMFYQNEVDDTLLSLAYLCKTVNKLKHTLGDRFPLIFKLLSIALTLPLSTAEVERVFSQVTLILSDRRNRLKIDNVENLLMVKLNGEVCFEDAVRHWLKQKNRRLFNHVVV